MDDARDNEVFRDFLQEAEDWLQRLGMQLVRLESTPADEDLLDAVFRGFHSLKGGAGFLDLEPIVVLCHGAEELLKHARSHAIALATPEVDALLDTVDAVTTRLEALAAGEPMEAPPAFLLRRLWPALTGVQSTNSGPGLAPPGAPAAMGDDEFEALLDNLHGQGTPVAGGRPRLPATYRAGSATMLHVAARQLDGLATCVETLVAACGRLDVLAGRSADSALAAVAVELGRATVALHGAVTNLRLQPIGQLFQRFPRVVRELARKLGKDVELVFEGGDTDIDRDAIDALADALVHLLRNALDHGIGTPDERQRGNKPPRGRITLTANRSDGCVRVVVGDDGRGMDPAVLRRRAVALGLFDAATAADLDADACLDLVLRPGFTTADQVSEFSGRGFGMDVVRTRMAELGGRIELRSTPGHGTEVELRIPLARVMPLPAAAARSAGAGAPCLQRKA